MDNNTTTKQTIKAVSTFAKALGFQVKTEKQADGSTDLVLYQKGEPVCTEFNVDDMVESLAVYAGGHPQYKEALEEYVLSRL